MPEKKVLVIAYYFPPMGLSGVQRTLKFVKYLPEFGWEPTVLTTSSGSYFAYDDSLLEEIAGTNIIRTEDKSTKQRKYPSTFNQKIGRFVNGFFMQPDSKIGWKKKAIAVGSKIIEESKPDVILSTAPPFTSHLVAAELADKYGIPLVLDYRDQWYGNPFNSMPTKFHKNY
ncbi:glycosyl transferase family 1, partial [bacterium]